MQKPELNIEGAEVTLTDVYAMFYLLLKQNQKLHPGSRMSFDLNAFKTLPKKVAITEKPSNRKKSDLVLPEHKIITVN